MNWKVCTADKHGNRIWESLDGMLRVKCSEWCEGIALPRLYQVWAYARGTWHRKLETKSGKRARKFAETLHRSLEDDE